MPGNCVFRDSWLDKKEYKLWLSAADKHRAFCFVCKRSIFLGSMGEGALSSHSKGTKHKKAVESSSRAVAPITSFCTNFLFPAASSVGATDPPAQAASRQVSPASASQDLTSHCTNADVLRAEVLWVIKSIDSHYSMNSSANAGDIFKLMFPDSKIASQFSCGETKARYLTTFGLGPYFADRLFENLRSKSAYVLMFDETLNEDLQEKQLDIYVRFADNQEITTRYLQSEFLGHASAADLFEKLTPVLDKLNHQKLLQLSMDGPNVNLKLRRMVEEYIQRSSTMKLLETGTCGLHILHNAFRGGCTAAHWGLETVLKAAFNLFDSSPARRQDFLEVTDAKSFPLQYCSHRWLENVRPAERLLELLPELDKYCAAAKSKRVAEPCNQSYKDLTAALADPLIKAKLQFFICIAKDIEPFLQLYQTDHPMMPFIATDLSSLIRDLLNRFIKPEVLSSAKSLLALSNIDFEDKSNHLDASKVDVGFAASQMLRARNAASDKTRYSFRVECREFLFAIVKKLMEKAPIKYPLVRSLSWMDPRVIVKADQMQANLKTLDNCLRIICMSGRVIESNCDTIKAQFRRFGELALSDHSEKFRTFDHSKDKLDHFFYELLHGRKEFALLWGVVQQLLVLSHGQATVERGFSVNKETMVENLHKKSLVARRMVLDAVRRAGGPEKVVISKELLGYASAARRQYHNFLATERERKATEATAQKRKAKAQELEHLKTKKQHLEKDIAGLEATATDKAEEAERQGALTLIVQSNALRRRAAEKKKELEEMLKTMTEIEKT